MKKRNKNPSWKENRNNKNFNMLDKETSKLLTNSIENLKKDKIK